MGATLLHGDCIDVMRGMPDNSVDSIVTDPPYGLGFMGKKWDDLPPGEEWARECLRVLKPGGHMLAFGGTRTWHRLAVAVEDAGFEIRDSIAWMHGQGFPKNLDVSKAIDKRRTEDLEPAADVARWLVARMAERGVTRRQVSEYFDAANIAQQWTTHWTDGAVKPRVPRWNQWLELRQWLDLPDDMDAEVWRLNGKKGAPGDAWGQREVLGMSDVLFGRKSGIGNATAGHHTVGGTKAEAYAVTAPATPEAVRWQGWGTSLKPAFEPVLVARKATVGTVVASVLQYGTGAINIDATRSGARWPTNVVLDESQAERLAESRYFYVAKPSKSERPIVDGIAHPTVKPLALMQWLCRLVTPAGGTVLEPFAGSGTTVEAALIEGFDVIGIEREAEYLPLIQARIDRQVAA
jgi:DNA modification methylase